MIKGDERRESQIECLKKKTDKLRLTWIRRSFCNFFLRAQEREKKTPDTFTSRVACRRPFVALIPVNNDVILCHAISMSQSNFTGNLWGRLEARKRQRAMYMLTYHARGIAS